MPRPARNWIRGFADAALSVILPSPCRLCESILLTAERLPVCPACREKMRPIEPPLCWCCGRPFASGLTAESARPLCRLCRNEVYAFDHARSFAAYDDVVVRAIILLKYHAVRPLGRWFAERMVEQVRQEPEIFQADVLVPVPLHLARRRERGYNQAELIARPLARMLGLPLGPLLLVRTRPRPVRQELTRRERWETVRGAYETREGARVDKLRVLLVDDVLTTGATLDACARALRDAGVSRVAALTVARVVGGWATKSSAGVPASQPTRGWISE
jgi:ComF family protein